MKESRHPLLRGRETTYLKSWDEWLKLWNAHTHVELRHGLLHVGLNACDTLESCFLFYLAVADGWQDQKNFAYKREGEEQPLYPSHARAYKYRTGVGTLEGVGALEHRLATKAFAVLFNKLTEITFDLDTELNWTSRQVLALLRFFRPMQGTSSCDHSLRNLPMREMRSTEKIGDIGGHLVERVRTFLGDLIVHLWTNFTPFQKYSRVISKEPEELNKYEWQEQLEVKQFNQREKEFAESLKRHHFILAWMLAYLGRAKELYKLPMDERTIRGLTRLVLRTEIYVNKFDPETEQLDSYHTQRVHSVSEAATLDSARRCSGRARSEIARFLIHYHERVKAQEELESWNAGQRSLFDASRRRREREEKEKRIAELTAERDRLANEG